jgi:CelD/BcsL family acetyltransferase involved in cellulose biosynthesis
MALERKLICDGTTMAQLEPAWRVRPGIVLHAHAIRRAIAAGRHEYDFLGGASRYKVQLATATRPLLRMRAVRSPRLEMAHSTAQLGFDQARRLRDHLRALGDRTLHLGEPRIRQEERRSACAQERGSLIDPRVDLRSR